MHGRSLFRGWNRLAAPASALLALWPALAGAAPPQRVEVAYEIARAGSVIAEVSDRLEHDGKSYRLSETWKGRGVYALRGEAKRSSRGSIGADGLRPLEFEDQRSGRDTARARFDWGAKTLTLQHKGAAETRPLAAGTHDRLSFLYGFAFNPPGAQPVAYTVADGKGVTAYIYQAAGRERLKTQAGEFDALKLIRRKDGAQDRGTEIWLAVDRHYLPVRIVVTEKDGTRLDQVAVRIAQ
ncbi:MAG: DUF3108 domain-containing protein [Burkholderiales bacterium]